MSDPVSVPRFRAQLNRLSVAFRDALVAQLQPAMLFALLLPLLIFTAGIVVLSWFFWTPLSNWLNGVYADLGWLNSVDSWLLNMGLFSLKAIFIPLAVACIIFPSSGILALTIAAIFVMPLALKHAQKSYPGLERKGKHAWTASVWNGLSISVVFIVGWLLTLPFWLVPPLGLILPVFWWTFAFTYLLRFDALVEHASPAERRYLLKHHRLDYWWLGFAMALINLIPLTWIFLPVYSALVFAYFSLAQLQQLRAPSLQVDSSH